MAANITADVNITGEINLTGALNGTINLGGGSEPVLQELKINQSLPDGQIFTPPEGVDGFSKVDVPKMVTYSYTNGNKFAICGIPGEVVDAIDYVMAVGTSGVKYFDKRK